MVGTGKREGKFLKSAQERNGPRWGGTGFAPAAPVC